MAERMCVASMSEISMAMKTLLRKHLTTWALADAIEIRYSWPIRRL